MTVNDSSDNVSTVGGVTATVVSDDMSNSDADKLVQDPAVDSNEESAEEVSSPDGSPGKLCNNSDPTNDLEGLVDQISKFTFDPDSFVRSLPAPVRRRLKVSFI